MRRCNHAHANILAPDVYHPDAGPQMQLQHEHESEQIKVYMHFHR